MKKNSRTNTLEIEKIGLSAELKDQLKMLSLEEESDINTFDVNDLKMMLSDSFEEFYEEVLKPFHLPNQLAAFKLEPSLIKILESAKIKDVRSLIDCPRSILYELVKDDMFDKKAVDDILGFFGFAPLEGITAIQTQNAYVQADDEETVIDVKDRLKKVRVDAHTSLGVRKYSHFKIRLASPSEIKQWSYGEVKNTETLNYRSGKPVIDGLFCEKIFGPIKDCQCACGKKQAANIGTVCEKCGIEITDSKVRRERMGHIELASPIVHPWYLKNSPSILALLLNIKAKELIEIVFYIRYVIIKPATSGYKKGDSLPEQEYHRLFEESRDGFYGETGAEAIRFLLKDLNIKKQIIKLNYELNKSSSKAKQRRTAIIKRLEVLEAFNKSDNKPEWMVMDVIPVLPPDLRPMVALDGGRYATTDLNDLYRSIISRNTRLKKFIDAESPALLIKNEKRLLQEAVESLFDSSKKNKALNKDKKSKKKSITEVLKGKQGIFRQNLLGKRVDYSGRSVIIIGPDLQMYQCGIPREMAYILFKPFILEELEKRHKEKETGKPANAAKDYDSKKDECYEILEKVAKEHPVLLNRAPTLHRLGIQAFEPKLIDGKAIRLHPLVTTAFNADFDGDQMAVHLPLSNYAQAEARLLMLASNNILNPSNGAPIVTPTQDMVIGNYYLTTEEAYDKVSDKNRNEGRYFATYEEALFAVENKVINLHTRIIVDPKYIDSTFSEDQKQKYLVTTFGKLTFNKILPSSFPYLNTPKDIDKNFPSDEFFIAKGENFSEYFKSRELNSPLKKDHLSKIISRVFKMVSISETSVMLDKLKDLGFKYSTQSGISISFADVNVYSKKNEKLAETEKYLLELENEYELYGTMTAAEKKDLTLKKWESTRKEILEGLMKEFPKDNNVFIMMDSGARGKQDNFSQLAGMRGLMQNPKGETIEIPIQSSFRQGLTVSEFFISTHGARKGSTDIALKTSKSGYLTRRLVDVAHEVIISEDDCCTDKGVVVKKVLSDDGNEIVKLYSRIVGRYAAKDIVHKKELLVLGGELITEEIANRIVLLGITEVEIRSSLTCGSESGICAKCYGKNLATNTLIEVGEAVGIIAAQSIGEPGTQLTMRTFHTGGVSSVTDITQGLPRVEELFENRTPKGKSTISNIYGEIIKIVDKDKKSQISEKHIIIKQKATNAEVIVKIPSNSTVVVKNGDKVVPGQKLTEGSIHPRELFEATDKETVQQYIIEEIQKVYRAQGVEISDKHIEIIVRQMFKRVIVQDEGDTELLPGIECSLSEFSKALKNAIINGTRLPIAYPVILGIAKAASKSDSFLSAASFQETQKVLTNAAIRGKIDELIGLKENALIGGLIPAGTGSIREPRVVYSKFNSSK
ncbi:MAG: DNA-directed RNA polymerase subunit beta' [Acholeplasmatales bacterium]|jgi:DNA-directed RNA polymerase subunit beta'|nr:DNA-directed RNA polymerase subunit beta' [Acholeplasmatales bacterium]